MKLQTVLFTTILLAACSQQPDNAEDQPMPKAAQLSMSAEAPSSADATAATGAMTASATDMQMSEVEHEQVAGDAQVAAMEVATGTVESIDAAAGKITIDHGPVDALGWPAMTMGFQATPEQIASVQAGQRVRFEFTAEDMNATITRIEPLQ